MQLADLVFIAFLLGTFVAVIRAGIFALRRRGPDARRVLARTAVVVTAYLAVVVATSVLTPRRWIQIGEEQRFDEWALTVLRSERDGGRYRIAVRVANHARGRSQRAADADLRLVAADGRRFAALDAPGERSLRSRLEPGESFETVREFDVPPDVAIAGLDVVHGAWPELFIVGDRGSLLHKRPLVRIE